MNNTEIKSRIIPYSVKRKMKKIKNIYGMIEKLKNIGAYESIYLYLQKIDSSVLENMIENNIYTERIRKICLNILNGFPHTQYISKEYHKAGELNKIFGDIIRSFLTKNKCTNCNSIVDEKHECNPCWCCGKFTPDVSVTDGYIYWKCKPIWIDCKTIENDEFSNCDNEEILEPVYECDCYDLGYDNCTCYR